MTTPPYRSRKQGSCTDDQMRDETGRDTEGWSCRAKLVSVSQSENGGKQQDSGKVRHVRSHWSPRPNYTNGEGYCGIVAARRCCVFVQGERGCTEYPKAM